MAGNVDPQFVRMTWVEETFRSEFGSSNYKKDSTHTGKVENNTKSTKKSYADNKRRELKFQVGDHVFLKMSTMKNIMRFGKKGKLYLRYVGPFEVLEKVGALAYRVALPPKLGKIHNVFHVSSLRKYVYDASHVVEIEPI